MAISSSRAALPPTGARKVRAAIASTLSIKNPANSSGHRLPANRPKDNSFSLPYIGWQGGKRVLYATMGDGSVVGVNARTGDPLWRVTDRQSRHQLNGPRSQQRQSHRDLRHALRTRPNGRAKNSASDSDQRRDACRGRTFAS